LEQEMSASLETLVIAAYVFATSLRIPCPGPEGKVIDPELVVLAVAQAATGLCSDRQFLGAIGRLLPGYFPELPDQIAVQQAAPAPHALDHHRAADGRGVDRRGQVRLVDGTLIACANYSDCQSHSEFAGHASYGMRARRAARRPQGGRVRRPSGDGVFRACAPAAAPIAGLPAPQAEINWRGSA
jgi:hypothetical protein